jgi:branched-chain amino acid transport system permease protein
LTAIADTLLAAVTVGSLYALVALGYTLVYGVLKFINFAHSDIFVLGAWTSFTAAVVLVERLPPGPEGPAWWMGALVLASALLVCGSVGYVIERFAYRPLRKAPRLNVLITAIGVSLLLQNVGQLQFFPVARSEDGQQVLATVPFGPTPKNMPTLLPEGVLNDTTLAEGTLKAPRRGVVALDADLTVVADRSHALLVTRTTPEGTRTDTLRIAADEGTYPAGTELSTSPRRSAGEIDGARYELVRGPLVPIRLTDVLIVASSLVLMAGLQVLVFRTRLGAAMRALSFNVETAALMGINVNRVISFTFVLGTALAAAAAFLYTQKYPGLQQSASSVWVLLGLKAFVAAVVGGIGNVRGAVLGGFLIAGIEFFGTLLGSRLSEWMGLGPGLGTGLRDVYVFALLIVVLLVRPSGLLGTAVREKV